MSSIRMLIYVVTISSWTVTPGFSAFRSWTHAKTKTTIQAELIGFSGSKIRLLNREGKQAFVKVSALSKPDQQFLKKAYRETQEAKRSFEQGVNALNNGLFGVARPKLKVASELNNREIAAEFALGILAIGVDHDPKSAGIHFEECINRWKSRRKVLTKIEQANYAAVLNNLALINLRNRKFQQALKLWRQAIDLQDETPQEMIQNLGTVSAFMVTNMKTATAADIPIDRSQEKALNEVLKSVNLGKKTRSYQTGVGWLYMTYLKDKKSKPENRNPNNGDVVRVDPIKAATGRAIRKLGSGTGFLVHDEYIVTNRHVVLRETGDVPFDAFKVYFHPDYERSYEAEVAAYGKRFDLGLLRLKTSPKTKPIRFFEDLAPLGTEVFAIGFPQGDEFGLGLTVTKGAVAKHPLNNVSQRDPKFEIKSAIWHDAIINSGNSGGPLVTKSGVAVGVNFATLNPERDLLKSIRHTENYSLTITSKEAIEFVNQNIDKLKTEKTLQGDSTLEQVQNAVAYIELYVDGVITQLPRAPQFANAPKTSIPMNEFNAFEDRTCMACTGTQQRSCPNSKCKNGVIVSWVVDRFVRYVAGQPITINKKRKVTNNCPTCRGRKVIPCEFSQNGIDRRFQGNTNSGLRYRVLSTPFAALDLKQP